MWWRVSIFIVIVIVVSLIIIYSNEGDGYNKNIIIKNRKWSVRWLGNS